MEESEFTVQDKVGLVNQLLHDSEPQNISIDTYNGYSGYKPQYIVDAMNEAFGLGGWGFDEIGSELMENDKTTLAVSQVRAWIKDIGFMPIAWGQARVTKGDYGDARKGAQTDALKKALSYFSIGNRAYQGLLNEKQSNGNSQQATGSTQQANGSTQQATVKNTLHNSPPSPQQISEIARLTNLLGKKVLKPHTYEQAHKLHGDLAREWNAREQDTKI